VQHLADDYLALRRCKTATSLTVWRKVRGMLPPARLGIAGYQNVGFVTFLRSNFTTSRGCFYEFSKFLIHLVR
jgi:hypothetical protein